MEEKNDELRKMYIKEKAEKLKLLKTSSEERVQWNREKATLTDLNKKLAKMLEQINNKINCVKEANN